MQGSPVETEVKIPIQDRRAELKSRLRRAGFQTSAARVFEANTLYDDAAQTLRTRKEILRLRQAGDTAVITFKGVPGPGPYKSREEIETWIGSFEEMQKVLDRLGFSPVFRYEKYRTEFKKDSENQGVVTLDETPIGDFLELEGPGDWIDKTAQLLGFTRDEYVLESYGRLYLAHCERLGLQPSHMVFSS